MRTEGNKRENTLREERGPLGIRPEEGKTVRKTAAYDEPTFPQKSDRIQQRAGFYNKTGRREQKLLGMGTEPADAAAAGKPRPKDVEYKENHFPNDAVKSGG